MNIVSKAARAARMAVGLGFGALLLAGCAARGPGAITAGPRAPAPQVVAPQPTLGAGGVVEPGAAAQVALLAPLTAQTPDAQALARSLANAAELALRQMPAGTATLKVYDTRGDAAGAAAAAAQAAAEGASVLVGPVFAQNVAAVRPVAAQSGLTVIAFSNDPSVAGPGVYLLGHLVDQEVERATAYAAARGLRSMAAIAPETKLGDVSLEGFQRGAQRNGVTITAIERYPVSFEGIEEAVNRFAGAEKQRAEPTAAILIADREKPLQSVAAFLEYFDISPTRVKFFGPGAWKSDTTPKETALRGGWFAGPDPRVLEQFTLRYQAEFGETPHPLGSLGFDAMAAIGAMVEDARASGDRLPFDPQNVTTPSGFAGVNGVFRFNADGRNERGLAVMEVSPGGFVVIDPAPTSFAGN